MLLDGGWVDRAVRRREHAHAGVLDGVRWQDVFVPESTPVLHRLMSERGAVLGAPGSGPAMSASGPAFVSLPGYSEIFTGRRAHGCADNDCGRARTTTLFDEVARAGGRRRRPTPFRVTATSVPTGSRPPSPCYLEQQQPTLLYLGLGEPDEYAHRGDFPGYLGSLRAADDVVGRIFESVRATAQR